MKKTIYAFILTAACTISSAANAVVDLRQSQTELKEANPAMNIRQSQTELKKVCEVCPYADERMCATWVPNCDEELLTGPVIDEPLVITCSISNCTTCNTRGTACTVCDTGYTLTNGSCILTRDPIDLGTDINIEFPGSATTETVSSCPSGTTKSSDGCCCVNN